MASFQRPPEVAKSGDPTEAKSRAEFLESFADVSCLRVHKTFIHADDGSDISQMTKQSSEPKNFKPASSSGTSVNSNQAPNSAQANIHDFDADSPSDMDAPSDTEVPAETARRLSQGSCVDRSCMHVCMWYRRAQCTAGEQCKFCHFCTDVDATKARIQHARRLRRQMHTRPATATQMPDCSTPTVVAPTLDADLSWQGSCNDGTCGRGCVWQKHGCSKGSQCAYCHVCPPQADAAQKRERLEYLQALRGFHKGQKKQGPGSSTLSAAALMLSADLSLQGSCKDGMCGRGCMWQEHGCNKGSQCAYCHVCPPQADAAQKRERLAYLQALRGFRKGQKKQGPAQRKAHEKPVARADGPMESHPCASAQAAFNERSISL